MDVGKKSWRRPARPVCQGGDARQWRDQDAGKGGCGCVCLTRGGRSETEKERSGYDWRGTVSIRLAILLNALLSSDEVKVESMISSALSQRSLRPTRHASRQQPKKKAWMLLPSQRWFARDVAQNASLLSAFSRSWREARAIGPLRSSPLLSGLSLARASPRQSAQPLNLSCRTPIRNNPAPTPWAESG